MKPPCNLALREVKAETLAANWQDSRRELTR
jgi:hypothetical protein